MATAHEIFSFSSKFAYLSSLGLRADLHFSCTEGKVYTNFHAELGCVGTPHHLPQNLIQPSKVKPSKLRRRRRRERAKIKTQSKDEKKIISSAEDSVNITVSEISNSEAEMCCKIP